MTIALNDGSFRELFLRYHEDFIARSDLDHRMIFRLDNPTLERETQEPDTSWWLDSP